MLALICCRRVSVSLSVCHKLVLYRNDWTNGNSVGVRKGFVPPIQHCGEHLKHCAKLRTEKFAAASQLCCQQNSSTFELVDNTYDDRRMVAAQYTSVNCNPLTPFRQHLLQTWQSLKHHVHWITAHKSAIVSCRMTNYELLR